MNKVDNRIPVQKIQDFKEILQSNEQVIALVYASWCPFCVRFLPLFERASARDAGAKHQFFLFQDDQEIMADEYTVEVVPSVLFFQYGKLVKRLNGILGIGLNDKQLNDFIHDCEQG
jgi:Thioredoxin domain-containing protein